MENFIADLSQIEKLVRIIPNSQDLCNTKVTSALPPFKIKSITALEIIIPHIARHLTQAERILNGGKLAKTIPQPTRTLFIPTREAEKNNPKFGIKKPGAMRRVFCVFFFYVSGP